jgi:hypothetical protein
MTRTISLIQRVHIASPCTVSWDDMSGDERWRFCPQCRFNVYNLSAMTQGEAERLIIEKEGKLCARIYRRSDGTVLTRDCPKGLAAVRHHALKYTFRVAAAILAIFSASAAAVLGTRDNVPDEQRWLYGSARPSAFLRTVDEMHKWLNNGVPQRAITMGVIAPMPSRSVTRGGDADSTSDGH